MGLSGNAVIGQSGGPTAVINQSLVGAVEVLQKADHIEKILGAHHAVSGIVKDDFIELQDLDQGRLDRLAVTPSSGLGSSRDKPDEAYCQKILESFERHNVRYFFYAGGNDSSDTCRIVNEKAKAAGYALRSFHIPKTIDNDLQCNDHTPGFGSAAKFVACAFAGDNLDNKALPGIKINVVMGRHAGFLTAAAALARRQDGDGPHLIYVPEAAFDLDAFIADVDRVYKEQGRCLIAVSEGIHDSDGTAIAAKLAQQSSGEVEKDAHGNVQLSGTGALGDFLSKYIKEKLGKELRVRADTFGYLQRSYLGSASEVDQAEARAAGAKAAEVALAGERPDGSITINRVSDDPYKVEYGVVELSDVAAKTKHLPTEWIVNGNDVSEAFCNYARPLIGQLPIVEQL